MKPNFALNLSHEGISLLHRAKPGWMSIGEVSLNDPEFNEQLNILRKTAADLESGGLLTKLVIPNTQVLFTEIDAPGPDAAGRLAQIRAGLVGLTPYDVDDLVYDWRPEGERVHVAVVARETLQEAEAFANEFRFNPVSFVAIPVHSEFAGEPFFGPTEPAGALLESGETIEPDRESITLIEPGAPTPAPIEASAPEPKSESVDAASSGPVPQFRASARVKPEPSKSPPKPKAASAPKPQPAPAEEPPAPAFASRRARAEEPKVVADKKPAKPKPKTPKEKPPPPMMPSLRRASSSEGAKTPPVVSALDIDDVPDLPSWNKLNGAEVTHMPVTASGTAEPVKEKRRPRAGAALKGTIGAVGKVGSGAAAGIAKMRDRQTEIDASHREAKAMTIFGDRSKAKASSRPRFMGLVLTLLLLVALAVLALWSSLFLDSDSAQFIEPDGEISTAEGRLVVAEPVVTEALAPSPSTSSPEISAPADSTLAERPQPLDDPTPAQDAINSAIETALLDSPGPEVSLPTTEPAAPLDTSEIEPEALADGEIETALLDNPTSALIEEPSPDQVTRPPPTQAEAEASYAATGIWQLDPEPLPETLGGDRLENVYIASIDPVISSQDAVALPGAQPLLNDQRPPTLTPPTPLGTEFDRDARGFIRATSEGAVTPDGVQVFAGTPAVIPPPRPGTPTGPIVVEEAPVAPTTTPTVLPATGLGPVEIERLRNFRPQTRPDTLQETFERNNLGGRTRTELAELRPSARPLSVQEEVAAESEADEGATDDGTELAIAESRVPAQRPAGFAEVVANAERDPTLNEETETEETEVAAARVPEIPTRASVARAATERNAINLGRINLIGVYGSPADRRALVRLKSGRYLKVEVGDRIDGGRVAAIGDNELRYVKSGRNITLKLPRG